MIERNWYFQWQKTTDRCIVNLKNPQLQWIGQVQLGNLKFSRDSRGLLVTFPSDEYILLTKGKVHLSGYIISMTKIEGDIYIHVAWSTEGKQYEYTISANHWYAIWLDSLAANKLSRKHIARMNRFVKKEVGRTYAETWAKEPDKQAVFAKTL